MASENAVNDLGAQNKSILAVDDTVVETRRLQTKTVGGKNYLLTTPDTTATTPISGQVDAHPVQSDGTTLVLTTGGQTGQKQMLVGTIDLPTKGVVAEGASLNQIPPVFIGGKDSSGNARGATVKVLDSRDGLDTNVSSVASKQLVFFHSDEASHRLTAGSSKLFPTDIPGGSTWFDLDGYMGFQVDWVDNTGGADGATLQVIWSEDQTAYAEEFDTGNTRSLFVATTDNNIHKFIPKQGRYCKLKLKNGSVNQGSTVPNVAVLILTALPHTFTNTNYIANTTAIPVRGFVTTDAAEAAAYPFVGGMVDNASSPTTSYPFTGSSVGELTVQGARTTFTGTPLVTTQKLVTSSTQSSVTAGTTSGTLVASSTSRVGVIALNNGDYPVYYRLSSSACTTASGGYSGIIWPGCSVQIGTNYKPYSGAVTCITPTGTGNSTISLSTI